MFHFICFFFPMSGFNNTQQPYQNVFIFLSFAHSGAAFSLIMQIITISILSNKNKECFTVLAEHK